jgi:phage gpG-like protein
MALGIEITGSEEYFNQLTNKITNIENLTRDISEHWNFFVEEKFKNEGIPKWNPLAPSTLKARRKKGYTGKILQRTNMLQSSVMPFHDNTIAGVGTNNPYANSHEQLGNPNDFILINIPPKERIINFRKVTRGKNKGRVRFTEEKRAKFAQKVNVKGYSIKMPKRSFIALQPHEKQFLTGMVIEFLDY